MAMHGQLAGLPFIGALAPWRVVFVLCGLSGFVVSAVFLVTREPRRESVGPSISFLAQAHDSLAYILNQRRRFLGVYLGFAIYFLAAYGAAMWQVAMISRQYHMSASVVAATFGPIAVGFGLVTPLIGGVLVDWVVRRSGVDGLLWLLAIAPLLALPSSMAVMASGPKTAMVLCATQAGVSAIVGSAVFSYLQSAMPADMRGFSVSLTGLVNTLLGLAVGPTLVALMTDRVLGDPAKVGWAIFAVTAPAEIVAALLFAGTAMLNAPRKRAIIERVEEPVHG